MWVALLTIADFSPIVLPGGNDAVSAASALDYACIIVFGPIVAAWLAAVSMFVSYGIGRRQLVNEGAFHKLGLNTCFIFMTVAGAGGVYAAFGGPVAGEVSGWDFRLAALVPCGLTYYVLNTGLMSLYISRHSERSAWRAWQANFRWQALYLPALLPIGLLIALLYVQLGIPGVLLLFVPLTLARYSYKLYVNMKKAHIDTVSALTAAIDASDPFTHGHSDRVSILSGMIGREMGLSENEVQTIEYASLVHDIGKIAIQHEVLLKRGPLTEAQWVLIRSHPEIGASIISDVEFLNDATRMVLCHHERLDGTGYPGGLSGQEIPLGARIINVADAYDAMTSDRPYRRSMSRAEALEELKRCAGSQFDSAVVGSLLKLEEQGLLGEGGREEESSMEAAFA
jgi:HD-GYP domain-containing protein (c-di-GMP phosphodiesterase class II)